MVGTRSSHPRRQRGVVERDIGFRRACAARNRRRQVRDVRPVRSAAQPAANTTDSSAVHGQPACPRATSAMPFASTSSACSAETDAAQPVLGSARSSLCGDDGDFAPASANAAGSCRCAGISVVHHHFGAGVVEEIITADTVHRRRAAGDDRVRVGNDGTAHGDRRAAAVERSQPRRAGGDRLVDVVGLAAVHARRRAAVATIGTRPLTIAIVPTFIVAAAAQRRADAVAASSRAAARRRRRPAARRCGRRSTGAR